MCAARLPWSWYLRGVERVLIWQRPVRTTDGSGVAHVVDVPSANWTMNTYKSASLSRVNTPWVIKSHTKRAVGMPWTTQFR